MTPGNPEIVIEEWKMSGGTIKCIKPLIPQHILTIRYSRRISSRHQQKNHSSPMKTKLSADVRAIILLAGGLLILELAPAAADTEGGMREMVRADPVANNQFPFLVHLSYRGRELCGGSIISSRHVLTAAHCIVDSRLGIDPYNVQIRAGTADKTRGGQFFYVEEYYYHRWYNQFMNASAYDIAILKTRTLIEFSDRIQFINLQRTHLPPNSLVTAIGWGRTHPTYAFYPARAKFAKFRILSNQECNQAWGGGVLLNEICVWSHPGSSTCSGDSGGPLVYGNRLVGIVSFGSRRCGDLPNVFTNVPSFIGWIDDIVYNG